MHHRAKDITGLRVGYLTATRYAGSDGRKSLWEVLCDCGETTVLPATELQKLSVRGVIASCGCMKRRTISARRSTHGMSHHPAYAVWRSMVDRCSLPSHQAWRNYGARGVSVCAAWEMSFENFWRDMGPSYQPGLWLERKDNSGNYTSENCRWATPREQGNNKRTNIRISTPRGEMTVAQASRAFGVKKTTVLWRLQNGWPEEEACTILSTPGRDTDLSCATVEDAR